MIDQESQALYPEIQHYGCYLLSIIYLASKRPEYKGPKVDNPASINLFYDSLLSNGHPDIASDCTVDDPEKVFDACGLKVKQRKKTNGSVAMPTSEVAAFEILCYHWPEKNFYHFMPGSNGQIIYDPIHRGSNTAKFGKLVSKRLFDLV